jgi:hypothetical protein
MFVRHLMKLILFWPFSLPQEGILENEFPFAAGKHGATALARTARAKGGHRLKRPS